MKWISKTVNSNNIVSIYETNITLNTQATSKFKNAYRVMIGIDNEKGIIAFRPLSIEDIDKFGIDEKTTYKISIGSSYSRISNKKIIKELTSQIGIYFDSKHKCFKYAANWNDKDSYLEISY